MPYWLTNPDHGVMPVYSESEVTRHIPLGWTLLNQGESPQVQPKATEQVVREVLAESMRMDPPPVVNTDRDSLIPAMSLHEARDETTPRQKRKYARKAK